VARSTVSVDASVDVHDFLPQPSAAFPVPQFGVQTKTSYFVVGLIPSLLVKVSTTSPLLLTVISLLVVTTQSSVAQPGFSNAIE